MTAETVPEEQSAADGKPDVVPRVAACETKPGTFVFLEHGNTDGWIASDEIVTLHR